ncbi:MAG: penicillin-binding transpeptidase domain-containing protein [Negativicutes bacterium]|nr:penicillin-binding transpeptidase domain-containing protein [Negativicutes bacterium]
MLDDLRRNVRLVGLLLLGLLVILFVYVSYIQVVRSDFLAGHPLNRRSIELAAKIQRGQIADRNGQLLAYSEADAAGKYQRYYPYGAISAHVVGYSSSKYGTTGLESAFNGELSGTVNPQHRFGPISNLWTAKAGSNLVLTLDAALQETAYWALGNRRGAIVAMNPRSGAILAMASRPAFNPATIDEDWRSVANSPDGPLVNRAVQGLYPPGSTLKVMIADAALADKISDTKRIFDCEGSLKIGPDYELTESDHHVHGKINLEEALAVSCNVTFGRLSLELGRSRMEKTFERYGFSKPVGSELLEVPSRLPDFSRLGDGDLAQTGIGQGPLLVTPLRMAMLAAAIANKGTIMRPYLVNRITASDGSTLKETTPAEFITATSPALADTVRRMMVAVVNEGTGYSARLAGVQVAGKTGTAENPHGASHSWFIGFAPADNPVVAVAVIVENAGAGGDVAAPIARQIIAQALR